MIRPWRVGSKGLNERQGGSRRLPEDSALCGCDSGASAGCLPFPANGPISKQARPSSRKACKGGCGLSHPRGKGDIFIRENGAIRLAGSVEAGALVGELAMIANIPYSLSILATEDVSTARIDAGTVHAGGARISGVRQRAYMPRSPSKLSTATMEIMGTKSIFDKAGSFSRRPLQ